MRAARPALRALPSLRRSTRTCRSTSLLRDQPRRLDSSTVKVRPEVFRRLAKTRRMASGMASLCSESRWRDKSCDRG